MTKKEFPTTCQFYHFDKSMEITRICKQAKAVTDGQHICNECLQAH